MKKTTISLLLGLLWPCAAHLLAQNTASEQAYGDLQGFVGINLPTLKSVPGGVEAPGSFAVFGSSGHGLIGKRLLIGGSGWGAVGRTTGAPAEMGAYYGMGFADLGYVLRSKGRNRHHAFVGIGGGGVSLRYKNAGENSLQLADNLAVPPGEQAKVSAGGFAYQLGLSFNRLLFDPAEQASGMKIGLDLGFFQLPRLSGWRYEGNDAKLGGIDRPSFQGFFARITVGGAW